MNDIKEAADTIAKTTLVHIGDYTGHSDHDDLMSASPFYRLAYEAEMNDQGFFEHWYEGAVDRTADRIFRISQGDYEEASDLAFEVFEATIPAALPRVPRVLPAQTITKTTIAAEGPVVNGATNVAKHAQYVRMLELGQSASQKATRVRVLPDGRIRYYAKETPSHTPGYTRGAARVTEIDFARGKTRVWMEAYDHNGNVVRVHPKAIDSVPIDKPHYPPTGKDLERGCQ